MITLIGGLIAMCCIGIKAQNAVNKKFLDEHQASVLGHNPADHNDGHQD